MACKNNQEVQELLERVGNLEVQINKLNTDLTRRIGYLEVRIEDLKKDKVRANKTTKITLLHPQQSWGAENVDDLISQISHGLLEYAEGIADNECYLQVDDNGSLILEVVR